MQKLRETPDPTQADLEEAARQFFEGLKRDVDSPRDFDGEPLEIAIARQLEFTEDRIRELNDQLKTNMYDPPVRSAAGRLVELLGTQLPLLNDHLRLVAQSLAARAERQKLGYFAHQLTDPIRPYEPDDSVFIARAPVPVSSATQPPPVPVAASTLWLREAVETYLRKKELTGLGESQVAEVGRALRWLLETVGEDRAISSVTKDELRGFRSDLERIDVTYRGRAVLLKDRLTNVRANQIKSVTSSRYWKSVQSFFVWAVAEGFIDTNPSEGLKVEARKGEVKRTPEQFSTDELKALFRTPLFTGYLDDRRVTRTGKRLVRNAKWWSALLPLFTGLRAGEFSQLLPSDFIFDHATPHLRVTDVDGEGNRTKSTKNAASKRLVPLAPILLQLGLRQFVERRAKKYPKRRVFNEFRLGTGGRRSDGMTRFWRDYLAEFGLAKPGRATHVMRHTFVGRLRELGVLDEDVARVVGHTQTLQTAAYGNQAPLDRMATTVAKLDYGFDVIDALGGPFSPERHSE